MSGGFRKIIAVLALAAACQLNAAVSTDVPAKMLYNRRYAPLGKVAAKFGLSLKSSGKKCTLVSNKGIRAAELEVDKRQAKVNSMPVVLNFAPAIQGGVPYLSWSDFTDTLMPLLSRSSLKKHTPLRIVIDAGHGGDDPGALGAISKEKNVTLAIAKDLKRELESRRVLTGGKSEKFKVFMTRSSDYTISLEKRAEHCNRLNGQIFISIHADAASPSVSGIGTFSLTPRGAPSYNATKVETGGCAGHPWCGNSLYLAKCIQSKLAANIKEAPNRGLKRARFSVLRNTNCPAVLIETGFISNKAEEKKLNDPAYRKRLVKAIADGVEEYFSQVKSR